VFFTDPPDDPARVTAPGPRTAVVVTVGAAVTAVRGLAPQPLLNVADNAAHFLR
jgi:NADH-quinone oxidoreductase subunit N